MSLDLMPELPNWFWYPIVFMYGAIVGSFLNVVIYRLPLGVSVVNRGSACPQCNTWLRAWDNIPLLAFLSVGGKCRYCRTPISWRYFTIELLTACLWVALFHQISGATIISWVDFVLQALFASVLVAMIFIDLDHFIAPDELNYIAFAIALIRDITVLVIAWKAGSYLWDEISARFAYFGFLPRAIPGAITYGAVLFGVSVLGFVYYAREENESIGACLKRYFTFEEEAAVGSPEADTFIDAQIESDVDPLSMPVEAPGTPEIIEVFTTPVEPGATEYEIADEEDEDDAPPRLRFTPGILAALSALLIASVAGAWGLLALVIPWLCFGILARHPDESLGHAFGRFFRVDENDSYSRDEVDQEAIDDANQFAKEAETGQHGGMGLGDVKLALAIGALLGPILSLLSLFVATFVGAITGITIAKIRGRSLRYGIPFVPFMAIGAIVTMLYGAAFRDWYVGVAFGDHRAQATAPQFTRPRRYRPVQAPPALRRPGNQQGVQPGAAAPANL